MTLSWGFDNNTVVRKDRKKSATKAKDGTGDICEEKFGFQEKLSKHEQNHTKGNEIDCEKCDENNGKQGDLEKHYQNFHGDLSSPTSKRMKMKNKEDRNEGEEYDMMEIDDPISDISRKQDQKLNYFRKYMMKNMSK